MLSHAPPHNNNYQKIQEIPITKILDKLGSDYYVEGDTIYFKGSNGLKGSVEKNFVHDFTKKMRGSGGPFQIIKQVKRLNNRQTFQRFEEFFNISGERTTSQKKKPIGKGANFNYRRLF